MILNAVGDCNWFSRSQKTEVSSKQSTALRLDGGGQQVMRADALYYWAMEMVWRQTEESFLESNTIVFEESKVKQEKTQKS